jgi:molybdopterin molybdotransferase
VISYRTALDIIKTQVTALPARELALSELVGTSPVDDVTCTTSVPPFVNSAMDGFAVSAADTAGATGSKPVVLRIVATVAAGDSVPEMAVAGSCVEIMTGAPVPAGCNTVIPVEQVERQPDGQIAFGREAQPGQNIRQAGEDFQPGQVMLSAGASITPSHVMGLAATGTNRLRVRPLPRISVVTTGAELTHQSATDDSGLIQDSNGPYLEAFMAQMGTPLIQRCTVADDEAALSVLLAEQAKSADLIITTGGVSVGRFDIVSKTILNMGGELLFHKVAIRPGKPVLFAKLADGTYLFGLPGNPIAVAACLRFFVLPAINTMQGKPPETFHTARATAPIHKRTNLSFFGKAHCSVDNQGRLQAGLLAGQESFKIMPLMQANCWAIVPEGTDHIDAGELIDVAPLYPTGFLQSPT